MTRNFKLGGTPASGMLILFGVISIAASVAGFHFVSDQIAQEKITGTPDMAPAAISREIEDAGVEVEAPDCDVAGEEIDNGLEAACFADYMRVHALLATGGK